VKERKTGERLVLPGKEDRPARELSGGGGRQEGQKPESALISEAPQMRASEVRVSCIGGTSKRKRELGVRSERSGSYMGGLTSRIRRKN